MMIYALYYYLIRNRTNILALVDVNWSLVVSSPPTSLVSYPSDIAKHEVPFGTNVCSLACLTVFGTETNPLS